MPATFAHPAAIVPFRQWCPRHLNFAALVIGSMAPDFGYYIGQRRTIAHFAHTLPGSVLVALPSGLLALGLFLILRRQWVFLLPSAHRLRLLPFCTPRRRFTRAEFGKAALSVLLGVWTHIFWDAFTHDGSPIVQRLAWLRAPMIHLGGEPLSTASVLQFCSTVAGSAIVGTAWWRWHHRQAVSIHESDTAGDRRRWILLAGLVLVSAAAASPLAAKKAAYYEGSLMLRVFVFRSAIYGGATFAFLFVTAAALFYASSRKNESSSHQD